MNISVKGEYALHAVFDLALQKPGEPIKIADIARRFTGDTMRTTADLVPVVFRRAIDDPHQMGFAFSEVLAHVNYMLRENRLQPVPGSAGVVFTT